MLSDARHLIFSNLYTNNFYAESGFKMARSGNQKRNCLMLRQLVLSINPYTNFLLLLKITDFLSIS
jgi:hypothetical protein